MTRTTVDEFNAIMVKELPWALEVRMTADCINDGVTVLKLPCNERMLRANGTISGPTMMVLADATTYSVVLSAIGAVKLTVTTSFNINFLRRPKPADLMVEGHTLKLGKRLAVVEVKLHSGWTRYTGCPCHRLVLNPTRRGIEIDQW